MGTPGFWESARKDADAAAAAAEAAGMAPERCLAVGDVPGFGSYSDSKAGQPADTPEGQLAGLGGAGQRI